MAIFHAGFRLNELLRDPARIRALSASDRQQLIQQCTALILAAASAPAPTQNGQQPDLALTPEQVAERLNATVWWVREHASTELKSARLKLDGLLRFSDQKLGEIIRRRSGE